VSQAQVQVDIYGVPWPLPPGELCSTCGQPDNCGDCNHEPLRWWEVIELLDGVPVGDGTSFRPPTEEERKMIERARQGVQEPQHELKGVRRRRLRSSRRNGD
jgi:hypothetical protein